MMSAGIAPPRFLFSEREKRKRAVRGPKEKRRWPETACPFRINAGFTFAQCPAMNWLAALRVILLALLGLPSREDGAPSAVGGAQMASASLSAGLAFAGIPPLVARVRRR